MELNNEDEELTPRKRLGKRVKRLRERSGLSQRALCERLDNPPLPHSYLGRVERGEQLPSESLIRKLDAFFEADEVLIELWEMAQDESIPDYGQAVVSKEANATRIHTFASSLIPGLLQTEDYARALIRATLPGAMQPEDKVTALVERRMRRKRVFEKNEPPYFLAIVDESALKRPIGGMKCMSGQLSRIIEMAQVPNITAQVVPFAQGEHSMLGGSMSLLTLRSGATLGYVESFASGELAESPRKILEFTQMFDMARSKALPEQESLHLIHAYLKGYENEDDS